VDPDLPETQATDPAWDSNGSTRKGKYAEEQKKIGESLVGNVL
jgi:hypothetical protein